jgi:hypothetical protein
MNNSAKEIYMSVLSWVEYEHGMQVVLFLELAAARVFVALGALCAGTKYEYCGSKSTRAATVAKLVSVY